MSTYDSSSGKRHIYFFSYVLFNTCIHFFSYVFVLYLVVILYFSRIIADRQSLKKLDENDWSSGNLKAYILT
jgi:Ca2+-dependent lipid-binding protein